LPFLKVGNLESILFISPVADLWDPVTPLQCSDLYLLLRMQEFRFIHPSQDAGIIALSICPLCLQTKQFQYQMCPHRTGLKFGTCNRNSDGLCLCCRNAIYSYKS
jgi:hypothetical protein